MKYAPYTGSYKPLSEGILSAAWLLYDLCELIALKAVLPNEFGQPETLIDYIDSAIITEKNNAELNTTFLTYIND